MKRFNCGFIFTILALALLVGGCGYRLHGAGDLPFTEIYIGPVENRSLEPKLQDMLHRSLVEAFTKHGVTMNNSAGNRLAAVVKSFDVSSLAEKDGVTVEFRVIAAVDVVLMRPDGTKQELKGVGSPFFVSFTGVRELERVLASKEAASQKAMDSIASDIAGRLLYR